MSLQQVELMSNSRDNESEILIVEPSKLYQQMIARQLLDEGITAKYVKTGKDAIKLITEHNFSLICCELELADYDGIELIQRLRQHTGLVIPILLLTASDDETIHKKALLNGVTEVINSRKLDGIQNYINAVCKKRQWIENQQANVLYVEDSIPIAQLTSKVLSQCGYRVSTVTSAEESVKLICEGSFDLLMTDILLEGKMSGIALVRYVRGLAEPICKLPILAISGLDNADQKIEILRQGASDFISKPVDYDELLVRVRNLVRAKKLYDQVLAQEEQLRTMAITDSLTGLYNRHFLSDAGNKRMNEAKRHHQALSVIVMDLDFFKQVNDNYGHVIGDSVLKQVSKLLQSSCREEDFAVRFGGEEFVLVLAHCGLDDAMVKAKKLQLALEKLRPENIEITGSFGVFGLIPKKADKYTFDTLFNAADKAVYTAKEMGRNQVCKGSL